MNCEIDHCGNDAFWALEKDGRVLRVCFRCSEEMTALYGWEHV